MHPTDSGAHLNESAQPGCAHEDVERSSCSPRRTTPAGTYVATPPPSTGSPDVHSGHSPDRHATPDPPPVGEGSLAEAALKQRLERILFDSPGSVVNSNSPPVAKVLRLGHLIDARATAVAVVNARRDELPPSGSGRVDKEEAGGLLVADLLGVALPLANPRRFGEAVRHRAETAKRRAADAHKSAVRAFGRATGKDSKDSVAGPALSKEELSEQAQAVVLNEMVVLELPGTAVKRKRAAPAAPRPETAYAQQPAPDTAGEESDARLSNLAILVAWEAKEANADAEAEAYDAASDDCLWDDEAEEYEWDPRCDPYLIHQMVKEMVCGVAMESAGFVPCAACAARAVHRATSNRHDADYDGVGADRGAPSPRTRPRAQPTLRVPHSQITGWSPRSGRRLCRRASTWTTGRSRRCSTAPSSRPTAWRLRLA